MRYEMNQDDLTGFIEFIGAETKVKGKEVVFRFCPKCGSSAPKDDEWKFAVNWQTGAFGCLRGSCGYHGHFVELCRDFGYKIGLDVEQRYVQFPQPKGRITPRESAIKYLEKRGISKEIAERYEVTAFEDKPNILWFPFFNEYGKLVYAKFRKTDYRKGRDKAKEWTQAGGEPILFGMKRVTGYRNIVITEGQIDSLSVAEAFKGMERSDLYAVMGEEIPDAFCSVPNGCNAFTWIPNCLEWLKRFDTVIVFGDMEKGHMSLLDTLRQRLPNRILAVQKEDYLGEKDANDILQNFGAEAVRKAVWNAREQEISNVKELADVQYVDITKLPKVRTGIYELDSALKGGICYGQVCLLTGKRGDGKSTFMSNIFAEAIDQGVGAFAYSGELPGFHFKGWLNLQLAGNEHLSARDDGFGGTEYFLDADTDKKISEWYRGKAYIYDNNALEGEETDSLLETIRKVANRKNVKLFCIDNLMTAMDIVEDQNNLYLAQSNFVRELKEIAIKYDVAIILVAHPRKAGKDEKGSDFDNDIVSGSSNITDRVDIVLNYSRAKEGSDYDSLLQIGKSRLVGTLKLGKEGIPLNYSPKTKRVFGLKSMTKRYGWETDGYTRVDDIDVPF